MRIKLLLCGIVIELCWLSFGVSASEITDTIPIAPTSADALRIRYRVDLGQGNITLASSDYSSVTVAGNRIDISVRIPACDEVCLADFDNAEGEVALDPLPAGTYTVRLIVTEVGDADTAEGEDPQVSLPRVEAEKTLWIGAAGSTSPFSHLRVVPNPATAGEPVVLTMDVPGPGCPSSSAVYLNRDELLNPQGSLITVLQDYSSVCDTPASPITVRLATELVAGSYTVRFISRETSSGISDPPINIPLTVQAISPAFTGTWFDPTQSGHGLFLEVLPNDILAAFWFTFSPDGKQAWVGGTGPIADNTATVAVQQTTGGRFIPNFDPAAVENTDWGTFNFTFIDCNHIKLDFNSTIEGYGSGSVNLTRLTQPAGLVCP